MATVVVILAFLLVGCGSTAVDKDDPADRDLPLSVIGQKCRVEWDRTHNYRYPEHYWCDIHLVRLCETYPKDPMEWCDRAVFFPRSHRCFYYNDIDACERATHVDCEICVLFRPAIRDKMALLKSIGP